jgi:hypothetical protein
MAFRVPDNRAITKGLDGADVPVIAMNTMRNPSGLAMLPGPGSSQEAKNRAIHRYLSMWLRFCHVRLARRSSRCSRSARSGT